MLPQSISSETMTLLAVLAAACLVGFMGIDRRRLGRRLRRAHSNLMAQHVEIVRRRNQLDRVLGAMHSLVVEVDDSGLVLAIHPTSYSPRHITPAMATGQPISALLPTHSAKSILELLAKARQANSAQQAEVEVHLAGERLWFFVTTTLIDDTRQLVVARDMTPMRAAKEAVARQERLHAALMAHSTDITAVLDASGHITYISPGVMALLGIEPERMDGRHFKELLLRDEQDAFLRQLAVVQPAHGNTMTMEVRAGAVSGGEVALDVHAANLLHDPVVGGIVLNCHDITYQRRYQETLQRQSFSDPLTGLANRALFLDRLGHAMARMSRNDSYNFAILAIDLDRFKRINESLGHKVGDKLLQHVGQQLRGCMRKVDTLARLQGDDFIVLLDDIADNLEAIRVAGRIRELLAQPQVQDSMEITLSSSVGILYGDMSYKSPEHLIRDAETAMRWAKENTEEGYKVFHSTMHTQTVTQLALESDLRKGIERNEFALHYQPIVDLRTGRMQGMEALLRWTHPERGFISPMEFIPVAEESGLIVPLGEQAIHLAIKQAATLRERFRQADIFVAVNLSPRQLMHKNLAGMVQRSLERLGLPAAALKLEVTESLVMQNPARARSILSDLKQLGCLLAIDDFGTGYSSLSHLCQYPFDTLKVDRSFISRLEEPDLRHHGIIQAIMRMADSLQMRVVAEGIETSSQIESLSRMGCPSGQGYFYAKPMAPAQLEAFLEHHEGSSGTITLHAGASPPATHQAVKAS